ncbi:MAG: hypothetical protein ACM3QZ_06810 [Solirubrobacterales bacterium]
MLESLGHLMESPANIIGISFGLLVAVVFIIWLFLKFCDFAKKFTLPGKVKMFVYLILTVGVGLFNYMFSKLYTGRGEGFEVYANEQQMAIWVGISLATVLLFTFALVSETKTEE